MTASDATDEVIVTASDLGRFVRESRSRQGLTQPELAAASGTGVRFIVDLESGKPTARLGLALHVLRMLGAHLVAREAGR